jgi:hypothetical protein
MVVDEQRIIDTVEQHGLPDRGLDDFWITLDGGEMTPDSIESMERPRD